jgi:hypothetical protein
MSSSSAGPGGAGGGAGGMGNTAVNSEVAVSNLPFVYLMNKTLKYDIFFYRS